MRRKIDFYISPSVTVSLVLGLLVASLLGAPMSALIERSAFRMSSSLGATHEKPSQASSEPAARLWQEV